MSDKQDKEQNKDSVSGETTNEKSKKKPEHMASDSGKKDLGGSSKPTNKKRNHLISDKTIQEKYGVSEDGGPENDPEEKRTAKEEKDPKMQKKRRTTYIIIGIVTACAVALILWLAIPNSGRSNYDNNMSGLITNALEEREGFPASISGTNVTAGNFHTMEKELVYVSDTSVVRLNQKAEAVYERSHSYYHPISQISGEYLMVYNVGSNGFRIDNKKETIRNDEAANTIMAADVAENGRYAVVTETKGYPSYLEVYLEDGTLQYKYSFSNCYVTDISLSKDGSHAAVIGVSANEGELISQVYLFDFNNETPLAIAEFSGTLLMDVEYCSDGRALAVGDNLIGSVTDNGEKTEYSYGNMQLAAYDFNENRALVALSPYDSVTSSKMVVVNSKGEEVAVQNCSETMTSVSLYGDTMAALSGQKVYSYSVNAARNYRGEEGTSQEPFHVTEAANDTKAIALADESAVYMLGISQVRFEDY